MAGASLYPTPPPLSAGEIVEQAYAHKADLVIRFTILKHAVHFKEHNGWMIPNLINYAIFIWPAWFVAEIDLNPALPFCWPECRPGHGSNPLLQPRHNPLATWPPLDSLRTTVILEGASRSNARRPPFYVLRGSSERVLGRGVRGEKTPTRPQEPDSRHGPPVIEHRRRAVRLASGKPDTSNEPSDMNRRNGRQRPPKDGKILAPSVNILISRVTAGRTIDPVKIREGGQNGHVGSS